MCADIVGKIQEEPIYSTLMVTAGSKEIRMDDTIALQHIYDFQNKYLIELNKIPEKSLSQSKNYTHFLIEKYKTIRLITHEPVYDQIKASYKNELKEKLATVYIIESYVALNSTDVIVADALSWIKNPFYKELLILKHESQKKGALAYNFSLFNKDDKPIRMNSFIGKVVFLDFWYVGCGPCIIYYQNTISRVEKEYSENPNVVFLSISIEGDKSTWLKALAGGKYSSPHCVNLYTGPMGFDHPIVKHYDISGAPKPMLIDAKGKIVSVNRLELGTANKIIGLIKNELQLLQ